MSTPF